MAVVVTATFDGATTGNATPATTGASSETGAAAGRQHSTAQKITGAAALRVTGPVQSYLQWTLSSRLTSFARMYLYRVAAPATTTAQIVEYRNTTNTDQVAALRIQSSSGDLSVCNASVTVAFYPMTAGQWYRVDWSVENGVGQTARLYTGATLHSSNTADAVAGGTVLTFTSAQQRNLRVGLTLGANPTGADFYLDEMVLDNATMPAPALPYAAGRRLERKVAGTWVPQTLEKKVSGVWLPQIIERKDAGVWS